jgi:Amt family ammonium transporter
MTIVFTIIKKTIGLRVSEVEEIAGLDIEEHGLTSSYADFMVVGTKESAPIVKPSMDTAIPVEYKTTNRESKMTKLSIITKQSKFETLKTAMDELGITGMTVTQVLGFGMQKGNVDYYRGNPVDTTLLPKVKVEIVVCKIPVDVIVRVVKEALYTGNIGDGKIFVYDVENVIKVRTGEEGYDALQDEE